MTVAIIVTEGVKYSLHFAGRDAWLLSLYASRKSWYLRQNIIVIGLLLVAITVIQQLPAAAAAAEEDVVVEQP